MGSRELKERTADVINAETRVLLCWNEFLTSLIISYEKLVKLSLFPPTTSTEGQENSKIFRERNVDQSVQNGRGEDYVMVRQTMRLVLSV